MKINRPAVAFLTAIALSPYAMAGRTIEVRGTAQFWERSCKSVGTCSIPQPTSTPIPLQASITEPQNDQTVTRSEFHFNGTAVTAKLTVIWRRGYLVAQTLIAQKTDTGLLPLAECSSFSSDTVETFSPVGACSGFLGKQQLGISFFK